jgi:hypothetical protein
VIGRKDDRVEAEKFPEPEAALGLHSERQELSNAVIGRTEMKSLSILSASYLLVAMRY